MSNKASKLLIISIHLEPRKKSIYSEEAVEALKELNLPTSPAPALRKRGIPSRITVCRWGAICSPPLLVLLPETVFGQVEMGLKWPGSFSFRPRKSALSWPF
ncbi:hypothetical protein I3842_08G068100 [Carya illinoinensis]|uniref:Uncharacterized protein n=1 Tax=Carya illinoinensis TaxID=32201 RepID=A0A922EAD7_CARIL|nr:hypothetical protein I3842_08G068100 [Carya illinoinensis]